MSKSNLSRMDSLCPSPSETLLKAVEQNNINLIRKLIFENQDLINYVYPYPYHNPILYIAINNYAETVLSETVQTLIDLGANLFYKIPEDDNQEAIHFAAIGQNPSILATIIKNLNSNQIKATTSNNSTALSVLIKNARIDTELESTNFEKCLKILLGTEIDVNQPNKSNQTPIVIAAGKRNKIAVTTLFNSGKFINIDDYKYMKIPVRELIIKHNLYDGDLPEIINNNNKIDKFSYLIQNDQNGFISSSIADFDEASSGSTYLQIASERNLEQVVEYLLDNRVDVTKITAKNEKTPIEIAALNGFWKIFQLLLPHYNKIPKNLLIPLLSNSIHETTPTINHRKCLNILFESEKQFLVNTFQDGTSALHFAAKYTNSRIVLSMLNRGASLANKNKYNFLPIQDISSKVLEKHFDNCIEITHNPAFDKENTIVTFYYKSLMPTVSGKKLNQIDADLGGNPVESYINLDESYRKDEFTIETDTVQELARIKELRHLLKHPLISSFLYLKWHKIRTFFYLNLIFYCVFVISLYSHIFLTKSDYYKFTNSLVFGVLIITWGILLLREFSQIMISPKIYFLSFENWLELGLLVATGIIINSSSDDDVIKQFSAIAILLSALELMLLIGQHPRLSTYIVIFRTVSCNFFKFLLWYAILILAFAFSFYKLFKSTDSTPIKNCTKEESDNDFFTEPDLTFIKIIIMLTGEFDASNLNLDTLSNKLLFLVFVFLIPIILFNLLNGLAVSDTQMIKNDAEIIGYIERINHIVYIENMMLGSLIPSTLLWLFRKCACCFNTPVEFQQQRTVMKWLAQKICLFPRNYPDYKMVMLLNMNGKVKRDVNGGCKRLKEIYLDEKTVKNIKKMLQMKNDKEDELIEENNYLKQIKMLQKTINEMAKCNKCTCH
ncbi:transient receptor potential cation channel protein painless-like [Onthophagus taurus]|uniref:transient receptor potential cation channel protein painless-like n=1 Tax=Onthophagus taurus TaxID=166361 RepID=UPI0039BEB7AF